MLSRCIFSRFEGVPKPLSGAIFLSLTETTARARCFCRSIPVPPETIEQPRLLRSRFWATLYGALCFIVTLSIHAETNRPTDESGPRFSISLSPKQQQLGGIRTQTLSQAAPLPSTPAYAEVVDPLPMLESHARIHRLAIEYEAQKAIAHLTESRYLRLQSLGENTQRSKIEQAKQDWLQAASEAEILTLQLNQTKSRFLSHWGEALSQWAENHPDQLSALQQGHIKLVRLIPAQPCDTCARHASIEYQQQIIPLAYLGRAPTIDPILNRAGFFFLARQSTLPIGLHLAGWFTQSKPVPVIPATAVVWRAGVPWVFEQIDEDRFQRRRLLAYRQGTKQWWVIEGLELGNRIVVDGAQVLLSLAYREQVPEEDEEEEDD